MPVTTGIVFTKDGSNVTWTTGNLKYKGVDYTIDVEVTGDTNKYIYWDLNSANTTFKTTNTLTDITSTPADKWMMCYNDAGTPYPALANKIVHGGIIQAKTITADEIFAGTITFDELRQVGGTEAVDTDAMRDSSTKIYKTAETAAEFLNVKNVEETLQTITETSEGGVIQISLALNWFASGAGSYTGVTTRLYRGASLLWESDGMNVSGADVDHPVNFTVSDIPGSGSVTYTLRGIQDDVIVALNARDRILIFNEPNGK
jgi:hypothetical protein